MTFSEFKFYARHEAGSTDLITFYTVPKDYCTAGSAKLPVENSVVVSTNEKGKRILNFEQGKGFYGDANNALYILDKDMAEAIATKIQMIRRDNILEELKEYEVKTGVLTKYNKYSEIYPEIFV